MKKITILTGYLSNNTTGNRRIVYWVNFFTKAGYKVNIITSDHFLDESVYKEISETVEVFRLTFFNIKRVYKSDLEGIVFIEKNLPGNLRWLQKIKRNIITKYFGQAFDVRVMYCLPLFCYLVIAKFKAGKLKFLKSDTDIVISTCPPYFTHLWSLLIRLFFKVKIVADYRDQFSGNTVYSQKFDFVEKFLDKIICRNADMVTTISGNMNAYYQKWNINTQLIYNGYDERKFTNVTYQKVKLSKPKTINYFGSAINPNIVPYPLFDYLAGQENLNIEFHFYGSCDFVKSIIETKYKEISIFFYFHGLIKAPDALAKMRESDINLIMEKLDSESLIARGTLPTKGFEYAASCRPIIAVCNEETELSDFLKGTGLLVGLIKSVEDAKNIFDKLLSGEIVFEPDEQFIKSFSRKMSTEKFESLLLSL